MNKKFLLCAVLVCSTASLNNALPSPKEIAQGAWNTVYVYGKTGLDQAWRYKYIALLTAAVVAGGIIMYESERVQKFIKELLGLEVKKPVKKVLPTHIPKRAEDDKSVCPCEIEEEITESSAKFVCPCELEEEGESRCKFTCPCEEASE